MLTAQNGSNAVGVILLLFLYIFCLYAWDIPKVLEEGENKKWKLLLLLAPLD